MCLIVHEQAFANFGHDRWVQYIDRSIMLNYTFGLIEFPKALQQLHYPYSSWLLVSQELRENRWNFFRSSPLHCCRYLRIALNTIYSLFRANELNALATIVLQCCVCCVVVSRRQILGLGSHIWHLSSQSGSRVGPGVADLTKPGSTWFYPY